VFIDVLALFSSARDRIFIIVAALIIAARPAIVDGVRFVAQPSFAIVAAAFFIALTLVALCPRFSDVVAWRPSPLGRFPCSSFAMPSPFF
jgi:hypothetical protein